MERMRRVLNKESDAEAEEPEEVLDAVNEHIAAKVV